MVIKQAELEAVCGITSKLPENAYPEVAFAGKSNVGMSSLINSLVNRKALARTSSQPGKTQTINFYRINQAEYLVHGFRLFDKVRYQGKDYFIFGRRKSGYFDIRDLNGEKVNKGSISYKKLRLVETRRSYLTERRLA